MSSTQQGSKEYTDQFNVLVIGPPNTGKSVIFNTLTGMNIGVANYPGTTIEYTAGQVKLKDHAINLIDVPGTYSLNASNEAEKVAIDMLQGSIEEKTGKDCHSEAGVSIASKEPEAVICVLDALNLESSLHLLLQVLSYNLPTMAVVNRVDLLLDEGKEIDFNYLETKLNIPFIPTVAVKGEGIANLKETLTELLDHHLAGAQKQEQVSNYNNFDLTYKETSANLWKLAEDMTRDAQNQVSVKENSTRQRWGELLIQPWPGLPLAIVILALVFGIVIGIGMGIRQFLLLPIFTEIVKPPIIMAVESIIPPGVVQRIFIGEYGFMIKGIEWPFTLVLPYIISFYAALSLLEDSGYLPRLGGLIDGLLNKVGLQGSSIIPILLGYGCGIPGIMSTRALSTNKERIMVSTMICLAVPCVAQSSAFVALLAERSLTLFFAVFFVSIGIIIVAALIMDRFLKGEKPYTLMEIPELLFPRWEVLLKKIWLRVKNFITDGALPMVVAVGVAALLYETGIMTLVGRTLEPLIERWLLLPEEAAVPLILGIMRRELTVLPLLEMDLTSLQLFTGAIVGLFYVPCIAIIATLTREFNIKMAVYILILTTTVAFTLGGIFARIGGFLFY